MYRNNIHDDVEMFANDNFNFQVFTNLIFMKFHDLFNTLFIPIFDVNFLASILSASFLAKTSNLSSRLEF